MHNAKKDSPSFHRNIGPIGNKLENLLGDTPVRILEIGSGSGQHANALARLLPNVTFCPSDREHANLASIDAWTHHYGQNNVRPARLLDVTDPGNWNFGSETFDTVLCFNVIHIAPWQVTEALFLNAGKVVQNNGKLFLYGPFRINGKQTSPSNEDFEHWLKAQDERFGVRAIEDVNNLAETHGFAEAVRHAMPANNFLMEFRRI